MFQAAIMFYGIKVVTCMHSDRTVSLNAIIFCITGYRIRELVWGYGKSSPIGPFRHSDISVKAVNQHGGTCINLYCVTLTYMLDYGAVT